MRKSWLVLTGFGVLLVLAAIGCNDDECASCPDPVVTPLGHARGVLGLGPSTVMAMEIFSNGALAPNPDSVKVGDSLVPREAWQFTLDWGLIDIHYIIDFTESASPTNCMYHHGDVATIRVWGQGRSSSCQLKILDPSLAAANITTPATDADTIASGAADTVFWNKVEHVDYYAFLIAWQLEGLVYPNISYHYSADTSFIVTGAMYPDSVTLIEIAVTPFTGPDPRTGQTNWSGDLLDGVVFSAGESDIIDIHVLPLLRSPGVALSEPVEKLPEWSAEEIVGNVYKQFEK
jgi:hypothetical protein